MVIFEFECDRGKHSRDCENEKGENYNYSQILDKWKPD
jgi:hypothetical protein